MSVVFHVEINRGPEQIIETKTGRYNLAALTALAMLDYKESNDWDIVKIWSPDLLPEYGPYFYAFDGHRLGIPDENERW